MKIIKLLLVIFIFLSLQNAFAANKQVTMEQNETKYVTLNMVGAMTASSVTVAGRGVTASISRKYPGKVKIKLKTYNSTTAGLRDIKVRLAGGINKTPLYVFGIKNAEVNITGPEKVGKFQKVEVSFPAIAGDLQFTSRCVGSLEGSYDPNKRNVGYFPVKKIGNKRIVWVSSTENRSRSTSCILKVAELSTRDRRKSQSRNIRVSFKQDSSVPKALPALRLNTPDMATSRTSQSKGNSPLLKWDRNSTANKYYVIYKKYNPNLAIPALSPVGGSGTRLSTSQNSYLIRNLIKGHYAWCAVAGYVPSQPSILANIYGPCNKRRFLVRAK